MSAVTQSPLFGIALTVAAYSIGLWVNRRTGLSIANPNLIAIPLIILCLLLTGTPLADYQRGGEVINMLLGPATAALALSIYRQREVLRESFLPVLLGCLAGCCASVGSTLALCKVFGLDETITASLLPKSVTTPIAVELSAQRGGVAAITIVVVIFTGIAGAGQGERSAKASAEVFNRLHPRLIGSSMLTVYPDSRLYQEIQAGSWREAGEVEKYEELKTLVSHLTIPVTFAALGASNAYQFQGELPGDREALLSALDRIIRRESEDRLRSYRTNLPHL